MATHKEIMEKLSKEFDITCELEQSYIKYIVDNDIPESQWLDVDKCPICGEVNHDFIDTSTMINGGVGAICMQCLEDL
jgi:hypothetical protein